MQLQGGSAGHGRARRGGPQGGGLLNVQHARADGRGAGVGVGSAQDHRAAGGLGQTGDTAQDGTDRAGLDSVAAGGADGSLGRRRIDDGAAGQTESAQAGRVAVDVERAGRVGEGSGDGEGLALLQRQRSGTAVDEMIVGQRGSRLGPAAVVFDRAGAGGQAAVGVRESPAHLERAAGCHVHASGAQGGIPDGHATADRQRASGVESQRPHARGGIAQHDTPDGRGGRVDGQGLAAATTTVSTAVGVGLRLLHSTSVVMV